VATPRNLQNHRLQQLERKTPW